MSASVGRRSICLFFLLAGGCGYLSTAMPVDKPSVSASSGSPASDAATTVTRAPDGTASSPVHVSGPGDGDAALVSVGSYTLQPGDALVISSFDDERLKRELTILPDGRIYFPGAGEVIAEGKTPAELEDSLAAALIDNKVLHAGSQIDVTVTKVVGNTIYVTGQVKLPGAYTMTSNITVIQALSLAGGLTPFASASNIRILRKDGGKETVHRFNYDRVEHGNALDTNITLHAGDTVIVP